MHSIGSTMPAAFAGAMNIDISATAIPPGPPPKPPLNTPVSRMPNIAAT